MGWPAGGHRSPGGEPPATRGRPGGQRGAPAGRGGESMRGPLTGGAAPTPGHQAAACYGPLPRLTRSCLCPHTASGEQSPLQHAGPLWAVSCPGPAWQPQWSQRLEAPRGDPEVPSCQRAKPGERGGGGRPWPTKQIHRASERGFHLGRAEGWAWGSGPGEQDPCPTQTPAGDKCAASFSWWPLGSPGPWP